MSCRTCDYLQPDLTSLSLTSETMDVMLYRILGRRNKNILRYPRGTVTMSTNIFCGYLACKVY